MSLLNPERNPVDPALAGAIGFMVISTAAFSLMNIFIRYSSVELHTTQIVFLRNLFSLFILAPWVFMNGVQVLKTDRAASHFWRGTVGVVGMHLWFYSVTHLPLNEATALSFTAPIFTAIFAIVFLREKAGWHRWSAILIGFAGAMVIIRPSPDNMNWDMLVVPAATSIWAVAGMLVKSLTKTEPPNRIVFYMALVMALWSLPGAVYHWQTPDLYITTMIFGVALASTAAHMALVRAYARADVVVLMPFDFCRLIFTAIFAYVAFGETSDEWTWAGGLIIVVSAAYIAHRETRRKARKPDERLVSSTHE